MPAAGAPTVAQASPVRAPPAPPAGGRAAPAPAAPPRRLQPIAPGEPGGGPPGARRGTRLGALFAVIALLVVPLGLGAYIATQAVYFVGTDDDGFVTMYRGLPYELPAGIELYSDNYVSGVQLRLAAAGACASA